MTEQQNGDAGRAQKLGTELAAFVDAKSRLENLAQNVLVEIRAILDPIDDDEGE